MKKRIPGFFAGALAALLVASLCVTALAAAGKLSYSGVNINLFGKPQIAAKETVTAPNGEKIPASLRYEDATGGATNYLPIRTIANLLDADIDWNAEKGTVELGGSHLPAAPKVIVVDGITISSGSSSSLRPAKVAGPFTMIGEKKPGDKFEELLPQARYQSKGAFVQTLHCDPAKGQYVTVTITNNNPVPQTLAAGFYREKTAGEDERFINTLTIDAGKTAACTFQIDKSANYLTGNLGFTVSHNADAADYQMDITATAVQFN